MQIGPTGDFPFGGPMSEADKGSLYASFSCSPSLGVCMMDFGTSLGWVATALLETPRFANSLRSQVVKAFGELDYDASQLPFRIARNASVIETHFPRPVGVLAANPHVFLAWAEKLEAVVNESMTTDEKLRFHLASAIRNQIQGGTNLDAATLDNLIARAPLELRQRAFETALTQCPRLSGGERASVELEFII